MDCDVNAFDDNKQTGLHFAAGSGRLDVVQYLVDIDDIELNEKDKDGVNLYQNKFFFFKSYRTPLHLATMNARLNVADFLVGFQGVDINIEDNSGKTALDYFSDDDRARFEVLFSAKNTQQENVENSSYILNSKDEINSKSFESEDNANNTLCNISSDNELFEKASIDSPINEGRTSFDDDNGNLSDIDNSDQNSNLIDGNDDLINDFDDDDNKVDDDLLNDFREEEGDSEVDEEFLNDFKDDGDNEPDEEFLNDFKEENISDPIKHQFLFSKNIIEYNSKHINAKDNNNHLNEDADGYENDDVNDYSNYDNYNDNDNDDDYNNDNDDDYNGNNLKNSSIDE